MFIINKNEWTGYLPSSHAKKLENDFEIFMYYYNEFGRLANENECIAPELKELQKELVTMPIEEIRSLYNYIATFDTVLFLKKLFCEAKTSEGKPFVELFVKAFVKNILEKKGNQ